MTLPYGTDVVRELWNLSRAERRWLDAIARGDLASVDEPCSPSADEFEKLHSFTQSLGIWLLCDVHEHSLNVQLLQQILVDAREWAGDRRVRNGIVTHLHVLLEVVKAHRT